MLRDIQYDAFTMFRLATLVFNFPTICHLRYDTIEEINVDSKAEYTA